jgi:hypothetical protein
VRSVVVSRNSPRLSRAGSRSRTAAASPPATASWSRAQAEPPCRRRTRGAA